MEWFAGPWLQGQIIPQAQMSPLHCINLLNEQYKPTVSLLLTISKTSSKSCKPPSVSYLENADDNTRITKLSELHEKIHNPLHSVWHTLGKQ